MLWIHVTTCVSFRHFVRAACVHACMFACPCVCTVGCDRNRMPLLSKASNVVQNIYIYIYVRAYVPAVLVQCQVHTGSRLGAVVVRARAGISKGWRVLRSWPLCAVHVPVGRQAVQRSHSSTSTESHTFAVLHAHHRFSARSKASAFSAVDDAAARGGPCACARAGVEWSDVIAMC